MDPEVAYGRMMFLVNKQLEQIDRQEQLDVDEVDELLTCIQSLNGWLKCGGFPPKEWRHDDAK